MRHIIKTKLKILAFTGVALVISFTVWYSVQAWTPVAPRNDPLVRMPGTQPGGLILDGPGYCDCHLNYDTVTPVYDKATEPVYNWRGGMMSQASRDFLFWSSLTAAAQDSIWAFGRPNATDLCLRCHAPKGWIEGRTNQLNGGSLTGNDFDGISCEFCHVMYDPFFEATYAGTREGNDWAVYFDESNASSKPSAAAATVTRGLDATLASGINYFNGQPLFINNIPASPGYTESASGQYFLGGAVNHRAGFSDASPSKTNYNYSRFHKSKYFCGTCHDVSNPILANLNASPAQPLPSETSSAYSYYHLQRTSSEFQLSTWGQNGGAPGIGPFDPSVFSTNLANNYIAKCQDCHMAEKTGYAARGDTDALLRPTASLEHPNSGQSVHDQTGANPWVSTILASAITGSPNYDATNRQLLTQGPTVLTLDLTQGFLIKPTALLDGVNRVKANLARTAAIQNIVYEPVTGNLSFRIQNYTAHKILTGYPEGRRMFASIQAYRNGLLIYEVNPYDTAAGTLKGLAYPYQVDPNLPLPVALSANEIYVDELVYEMIPTSSLTGEQKSFHFALATGRYKDNRIPPKGFDIANAAARLSEPVWQGVSAPDYFSPAEYAGGYDDVALTILADADQVVVRLYIQTTSREYIEFLRNEIKGSGALTLTSPTPSGEPQAYIVQSDAFFSRLKAWGDTLWSLWKRNKNVIGGAPYQIAQGTMSYPPGPFTKTSPADGATGVSTSPTLSWGSSSGATSYEYCYDTTNDNACSSWTGNSTNTSIALSGLSLNTTYFWHLRAVNSFGTMYSDGSATAFWSFTTGNKPGAFNKTTPANGAPGVSTSPTLSWGSSSGATSYEYCYDTSNDNACSSWTSNGSATSKALSGLSLNTTYYWHVRAVNSFGTTYSNGDSATAFWGFTTGNAPGAFTKTSPTDGATSVSTSPTLSWGPSSGATSYEYCYDITNDNACSSWTGNSTNTSIALSGLNLNTTYFWHVRAVNSFGTTYSDGSATAFWGFTTGNKPGAFNKTTPTNGATGVSTSLTLSWDSSSGATSYEYCYDTSNDNACSGWAATTNTSAILSGLSLNTTYYWHVRAVNSFGTTYADGNATGFWSFKTGNVPGPFAKISPANGATGVSTSPTLSWGSSNGAASYEYCYDTTNDNACSNWINIGSATSIDLLGLIPGTVYYWHVRSANSFGMTYSDGSPLTFRSFTTTNAFQFLYLPLVFK